MLTEVVEDGDLNGPKFGEAYTLITIIGSIVIPLYCVRQPPDPPPDPIEISESSGPLSGKWRLNFYFEFSTSNPEAKSRQWHNFECVIKHEGDSIIGTLVGDVTNGAIIGTFRETKLIGKIRFDWDFDWWESFEVDLNKNLKSGQGTAIHTERNTNISNHYSIRLIKDENSF